MRFLSAVFLQFTGTVGSGIFVLPYLFHRSNFYFAGVFLVFLTIITASLNQFYVDIVSNTKGNNQLAGYAKQYLGRRYYYLAVINLLLLSFGAIITYTKLFSEFFNLIFPFIPSIFISIIFLLLLLFIYFYRRRLNLHLFIVIPVFLLIVPIVLFIFSFSFTNHTSFIINQFPSFSFYGATLFALSSFTIIPEVGEILGLGVNSVKTKLSQAVLLGLILAAICYFLYIYSIIAIGSANLTVDSVSGLSASFPSLSRIIAVFGMTATLLASFRFLLILRELFYRDLNIRSGISNYLPVLFPVIALLLGGISLITVISLTGQITIFISALIICLIRLKLNSGFTSQFISLLIIVSLCLGLAANLFI